MANFLARNLDGPSSGTLKAMARATQTNAVQTGYQINSIQEAKTMYQKMITSKGMASVLAEQAENKTVIIKSLQYMQRSDSIVGSYRPKGDDHCCSSDFAPVVEGPGAYQRGEEFFEQSVIAHNARVIMLNPLHVDLPPLVVYLGPTCNTFDYHYVMNQWQTVQQLYNEHLLGVFDAPLASKASDGDSRRRKVMEMKCNSADGERFTLDHQNFSLSGLAERLPDGRIAAPHIMNQDYMHNGKKLTYPLDHAFRRLSLGGHIVHINHLWLVHDRFSIQEHGLRIEDLEREDRQNWASAQRMFFPQVQECLRKIEQGVQGRAEDVKGTRIYLRM